MKPITPQDQKLSDLGYSVYRRYVAPSALGFTTARLPWRKIKKVGSIHGLPRFAGVAFATDGILVAIELTDRSVVIGHLDSFEEAQQPASVAKGKPLSKLERLALEFA